MSRGRRAQRNYPVMISTGSRASPQCGERGHDPGAGFPLPTN
jgi:hypothetical protein